MQGEILFEKLCTILHKSPKDMVKIIQEYSENNKLKELVYLVREEDENDV